LNIYLIAVGNRMPAWIGAGYEEYAARLPAECSLKLIEIAPVKRGKGADLARIARTEADRMLAAIPKACRTVALDMRGKMWDTEELAGQFQDWMHDGRDVALLIGGPEGLDSRCRDIADQVWSLSPLTLPHPLVRVVVAEQLYRAWSILKHHPYHR
jgi:23S rRNA (pseudouridine1915-N3)-methyltransferase